MARGRSGGQGGDGQVQQGLGGQGKDWGFYFRGTKESWEGFERVHTEQGTSALSYVLTVGGVSKHPSDTGLLAVPPACHAPFCPWAFARAVPAAWTALPPDTHTVPP